MEEIIIKGTIIEELTTEDYEKLYDILMQLGIENIRIETKK